jgi:hypothetical protein
MRAPLLLLLPVRLVVVVVDRRNPKRRLVQEADVVKVEQKEQVDVVPHQPKK